MIDRRKFVAVLGGSLLGIPLAPGAQQPVPRLGILRLSPPRASYEEAFVQTLREEGYVDGRNLVIEDRNAGGNPERLPSLATELVRLPVAVIFARGVQALEAAKRATDTIPIVAFDDVIDPINSGYTASLARPGGNVTGVFLDMPELAGKWLELLVQVVPRLARVALLWDPSTGALQRDAVQSAARGLGKAGQLLEVREARAFDTAFAAIDHADSEALPVLSSQVMRINSRPRLPGSRCRRRSCCARMK